MLKILKQRAEIAQAQGDFERRFQEAGQRTKIRAGHKGETHELDGFWIPDHGIWVGFKIFPNRYWNAFGIDLQASNSISCEINFPIEGKNERVAGVFAEDEQGAVWVLHRGKIGGGKKGISKALFEKRYKGRWLSADGDPFAVVGNLGQADFAKNVADFVRFMDEMKHSV